MSHEVGGITMVEDPTQCFGKHIRGIHNSRKVNQNDLLDCVNLTSSTLQILALAVRHD